MQEMQQAAHQLAAMEHLQVELMTQQQQQQQQWEVTPQQ
jgi:hypothetical protein